MNCTFFGHRDSPDQIYELLKHTLNKIIACEGADTFYVGNNGNFDFMCQKALSEVYRDYPHIRYTILLSRINEIALNNEQQNTEFPEALERVPYRYAISRRNDIMIKRSDILIAFVNNKFSNSYKLVEKARRRGVKVINLYTPDK